jgi:DNA-binding NarL/FixJ family response regulator
VTVSYERQIARPFPSSTIHPSSDPLQTAAAADEQAVMECSLALLWRELAGGVSSVVDAFYTETRCGLVLGPRKPAGAGALGGRRLQVLQSMLSGVCQKRIAIELQLAPSTVALNARQGLESMGVSCRPSRVHPLLMLMATAELDGNGSVGRLGYLRRSTEELRVIGINRPDLRLSRLLSEAQCAVVGGLVEGRAYAAIADQRGTSPRTIANQLAEAFRKLQVSGRSELLVRLFVLDGMCRGRDARAVLDAVAPAHTQRSPISSKGSRTQRDCRTSGVRLLSSLTALASARGA